MTMASRYQATGDTPSRLAALFILQGGDGMRVRGGRDDERNKAWREGDESDCHDDSRYKVCQRRHNCDT